ncbi:uncharacterized protein LOC132755410 [Ruditapes philippinarum]|uniref:uncharacterized protein LOC132755410 n=1 Tax=Ruditapes philippinarum TaxID=129788 RepID=UPI00295BC9E5|nr:uncharacterized protein LOC132755410 [Ruditapes philippinarum]
MSKLLFAVSFLLSLSMTTVSACTCEPRTWIEQFCNDPLAGIFYIKDDGIVTGNWRVYDVDFVVQFRPFDIPKNPDFSKLYTPTESAACGVLLKKNKYYVITGSFSMDSGKCPLMTTNLCTLQKQIAHPGAFTPPDCSSIYQIA